MATEGYERAPDHGDEESPLVGPEATDIYHANGRSLENSLDLIDETQTSKSTLYLILLTLCIGGLQIVWSVELSNGSPFLLSLGMSKSLMAVVWLAGPMTGVLVQPYVGILSDNCRIPWGKRKPFMISGAAATIVSLIGLAWTREIILGITGIFGADPKGNAVHVLNLSWATVLMWVLDFSVNTIQAGIRAFIVDNAPAHQQEAANAWASRIVGIGNVLGYIFGYIDLTRYFPFFGSTQFKVLCILASIVLVTLLSISCIAVKERDPRLEGPPKESKAGLVAFFKEVFLSIRRMPPQIRKICEVQFCHWAGWFPFLFYLTTYIGQLYVDPRLSPDMTDDEIDELWARATRIGTLALLIFAIVSLAANVLLPLLIVPTYKPIRTDPQIAPTSPIAGRLRSSSLTDLPYSGSTTNISIFSAPEYTGLSSLKAAGAATPNILTRALTRLQIPGLTLRRTWLLAQLLFSLCMFSTFFISTPTAATAMTGVVGISWALTLWAPFALIAAEIAARDEAHRLRKRQKLSQAQAQHHHHIHHPNNGEDEEEEAEEEEEEELHDQAGVILGLHNVAVSSPQVVATLVSSVVFKFLQKPRNVPGDTSVGWCLRLGGVATLGAAWLTSRLSDGGESETVSASVRASASARRGGGGT